MARRTADCLQNARILNAARNQDLVHQFVAPLLVLLVRLAEGCDIADFDLVTSICRDRKVKSVIHFAAYKSVGESMTDPVRYFTNNVTGSTTLPWRGRVDAKRTK